MWLDFTRCFTFEHFTRCWAEHHFNGQTAVKFRKDIIFHKPFWEKRLCMRGGGGSAAEELPNQLALPADCTHQQIFSRSTSAYRQDTPGLRTAEKTAIWSQIASSKDDWDKDGHRRLAFVLLKWRQVPPQGSWEMAARQQEQYIYGTLASVRSSYHFWKQNKKMQRKKEKKIVSSDLPKNRFSAAHAGVYFIHLPDVWWAGLR